MRKIHAHAHVIGVRLAPWPLRKRFAVSSKTHELPLPTLLHRCRRRRELPLPLLQVVGKLLEPLGARHARGRVSVAVGAQVLLAQPSPLRGEEPLANGAPPFDRRLVQGKVR